MRDWQCGRTTVLLLMISAATAAWSWPAPARAEAAPSLVAIVGHGGPETFDAEYLGPGKEVEQWWQTQSLSTVVHPAIGFPKRVRSGDMSGLKPGCWVVFGVCTAEDAARATALLRGVDAGIRTEPVKGVPVACPTLLLDAAKAGGKWKSRTMTIGSAPVEVDTTSDAIVFQLRASDGALRDVWAPPLDNPPHLFESSCEPEAKQSGPDVVVAMGCSRITDHNCQYTETYRYRLSVKGGAFQAKRLAHRKKGEGCAE